MATSNYILGIHRNYISELWPPMLISAGTIGAGVTIAVLTPLKLIGIAFATLGLWGVANLLFYSITEVRNPENFKKMLESKTNIEKKAGITAITLFTLISALLTKLGILKTIKDPHGTIN